MDDLTSALLADTRNIAREQIEHIFEERMTALTAGVEAAVGESLAEARREISGKLNQSVRRLRGAANEDQWRAALVEAAQGFCDRAVLFKLHSGMLRLETAGNIEDVPLPSAPAFASAVESKDTVVAMRIAGEMSGPIAKLVGTAESQKFYIFPVIAREHVTALLYADAGDRAVDTNALELLATVAGAVLPTESSTEPAAELFQIAVDKNSQAQRFARVQVAEIRLYKSEEVKNGRIARDLYTSLRTEIDSAREAYRRDFLSGNGTMVDYLHQELLRTLANNDAELLGPGYPGPLA
ncbi:MAG TPA: hypothetical protein VGV35_06090 [Bryobacteraceae bacterium]|nr:hypothetical protein [Bryobacteraceae bacterium]